jgi:uncharacterized membrane protein
MIASRQAAYPPPVEAHSGTAAAAPPGTPRPWVVPAALVVLSLVPVAAGTARLVGLAAGAAVTSENARFFAAPLPAVLHILGASIWCLVGAFQFHAGLRRRRPRWHRGAGRLLVPIGLLAALSGLWLTQFYPPVDHDGPVLHAIRLLVGTAMVLFIALGFFAIRRRDIARHRAWMIRAYAIAIGAGTQVLTHLPLLLFEGMQNQFSRALVMGAGWGINLVVAEWIIRGGAAPLRSSDLGRAAKSLAFSAQQPPRRP